MIHIASTYTADVLSSSLHALLQKFCDQQVCFHYNQIFQQALLPNSEFNENKNGLNVFLIRSIDLFRNEQTKDERFNELVSAINSVQKTMQVPLLILFTPTQTSTREEKDYYATIEHNIQLALETSVNTTFISSEETQALSKTKAIFDPLTEKYGHIPYTMDFYDSLALLIARKYSLLVRKPYKVVVLDCDGTLWKGIIEEDGIDKLEINGEYPLIQQFMIGLFQAGFLLCLCSKNSEESVLNVFKQRKDMVLDINQHICSYRINWLPKSVNIQSLAEELDLGLDSFIFIDDNNVECAEVKAAFPEVLTIYLDSHCSRLDYLKNIWAFDIKNKSTEDEKRTEFYKQNRLRFALKTTSSNYQDFLSALKIKTTIRAATHQDTVRLIQLSQRTNQFNLFPNALSDIEFAKKIDQEPSSCLIIEVTDKYGDYGLVGGVVYDLTDNELLIRTLFLSCRILGREIEYTILNYLAQIAEQNNKKAIKLLFKITPRNIPGIGFLQHLANKTNLQEVDHVTLMLSDIQAIAPKITYTSEQNKVHTKAQLNSSNDYLLDIAQQCIQPKGAHKKSSSSTRTNIHTIEASLTELMKKHNLILNKNGDNSFIELGIDSLTCVLITSAIYQQFHVEIAPFALLKPDFTFSKLAHHIYQQSTHSSENWSEQSREVADTIPYLSFTQKQLWEEEQIITGTSRNNMFSAYLVEDNVDIKIMEKAFVALMARHDSLRFSFSSLNEEPILKLNPLNAIPFRINTYLSANEEELMEYVEEFRRKPFNLSEAPLFRVALIKNHEGNTILLFCIHHIIHDGWSLNILMGELSALYNRPLQKFSKKDSNIISTQQFSSAVEFPRGSNTYSKHMPVLNTSSSSYIDFIQWQHKHISSNVLEKQRIFWKKYLAHISKLDLIYDKTRKEEYEKPLNHRISFTLNARVTRKLKHLALTNQVTLYNVLSSAFGIFLSHYADQNDVNFITALSGRHHPHVANIVGLFTSLALIRMTIDNHESFNELIRKNKKIIDRVFKNQDLPFNEVIELTGEHVNSKIHAFNQAGFIFQSYPINNLIINDKICPRVFADDQAELIYDVCDECRFGNLVCFMQEHTAELQGLFEYNTTLFDKKRIKYMIQSFKTLLTQISEWPEGPARSIPMVADEQRRLLIHQWNQREITYTEQDNLLSYFAEQVIARENAVAVSHNDTNITYGELDKRSNQLARTLRKAGITEEMPIGIFLNKGIKRIIAMLSIIKAGGCYVPLELDLPAYRMNNIIKDSGLSFMITDEKSHRIIQEHYSELKPILVVDDSTQSESTAPFPSLTNPRRSAYIMYTSGSTGNPKGIEIEQKGILRLVKSSNYIEITSEDCIAQTSSFLFDASTFEVWGALLNGATLVLIDKEVLLDASLLDTELKSKKVTILFLTTQLAHAYAHIASYLFHNLNYLVVGGEALSYEAMEYLWKQKHRPICIINGYGPTENTTFSTTYSIKSHKNIVNPIPIGKPISGTTVYVLDHALNLRPIGAPGKLYVGGTGLARHYLNHEELNKEKFINYLGERLYDTGDIVTWKPDGNLKYLGRKDNQIKINGHRVELDEIAMHLETHHLVVQSIVLVKTDHYHRNLVAYVLLEPGTELRDLNLHHYLKTILPQYMLPKFYYQMDEIPLTTQGKVDKKALLKKEDSAISYTEYAPPTNTTQEKIIAIYANILNCAPEEISINAEFFDLGGNSISALHLIDKINQEFNIKINFSDIYDCADAKSLAKKITGLINSNSINSNPVSDNILKIIKIGTPSKTPIIFIHPIGGTGFCYLELIKLLPEDQPCYLIQDPSIEADQIFFDDMPSMATYYNQLLLKTLKTKFILAGYSFGGMLSLEMVAQLQNQKLDDTVQCVITFDTWVISNFLNAAAKEALRQSIMKKYKQVMSDLTKENIDPKPWMELYYHRLQNLGFAYKPPKINKKIILFKANQQLNEFSAMSDATNYLNTHTSQGVEVYLVSGNHDSILQHPQVNDIGHLLTQYLKDNVLLCPF